MKKFVSLFVIMIIMAGFCGCNNSYNKEEQFVNETEESYKNPLFVELGDISDRKEDIKELPHSKEYVKEFCDMAGKLEGSEVLSGITLKEENCYNVTPPLVSEKMDVKIFKDMYSFSSFILIDGAVYNLCMSHGGYGFTSAVPYDYDNDGNLDLLVTASWGSGMHRTEISYFNIVTKESKRIHSEFNYEVIIEENSQGHEGRFDIRQIRFVLDMMESTYGPYVEDEKFGYVEVQDGVPVYFPYDDKASK
ncbi:MAG: hypothetical protein IJB96_10600 [Lachnospira sp.]|nr:hypothetical protein [Lachnospira sp.]